MNFGEGPTQGIGYLDDGTMVVVEHARGMVGQQIELAVTSTLQTSAGSMIFGRMATAEKSPPLAPSAASSDEQHAASFQLQMALPLRTALADVSPRMTALLSLVAGENDQPIVTLGDLFEHPQPPIEILQIVKEWATQCMQKKNDDIPPRVAPVIYLAAVAAAFVKCQHRLTRSDDTDLQVTFRQALGTSWITGSVRHLFQNALQRLD